MTLSRTVVRLRSGGWSLADQAIVSFGNFVTNVYLARNLATSEYGVWALLYGLLLLFYTIHASVVTYPLSVADLKNRLDLRRIATSSLLVTLILVTAFGMVVFGVAYKLSSAQVAFACVLAMACWYLQETARRALMAVLRHNEAVLGDVISYIVQAIVVVALARTGKLSLLTAFLSMAATSALAAFLQFVQVGIVRVGLNDARYWWQYARDLGGWATLASISTSASVQAFPWFLALRGPAEAANFQALANVVGVTTPVMLGISNLIIPAVSMARTLLNRKRQAIHIAVEHGMQGALVLLPYYAFLLLSPHTALSFLYGRASPFVDLISGLRLFVFASLLMYVAHLACAFLYGLKQASRVFYIQLLGIPVALLVGLPLSARYGVTGACAGVLTVYATRLVIALALLRNTDALLTNSFNAVIPAVAGVEERR